MLPEPITHPRCLRLGSGQGGQVREGGAPGKSKNVREIPHPPRRVRNDKEQRLDSGGWKSEIRRKRLGCRLYTRTGSNQGEATWVE